MDRITEPDSLQLDFSRAVPSLILASSSPNRKALLEAGGSHVDVFIPSTDEEKSGSTPVQTVSRIADGKIKAYLSSSSYDPTRIAIAADTLVLIDGELLGKPSSEEDAWTMLRKLSGRTQTVISAAGVKLPGQDSIVLTDTADVVFRTLTDDEIGAYISTGEWDPLRRCSMDPRTGTSRIWRKISRNSFRKESWRRSLTRARSQRWSTSLSEDCVQAWDIAGPRIYRPSGPPDSSALPRPGILRAIRMM